MSTAEYVKRYLGRGKRDLVIKRLIAEGMQIVNNLVSHVNTATDKPFVPVQSVVLPIENLRLPKMDRRIWRNARVTWLKNCGLFKFDEEPQSFSDLKEHQLYILAALLEDDGFVREMYSEILKIYTENQ